MTISNFSSLHLSKPVLVNLTELGYTQMTPVQAQSLPHILHNKDVIAQAKTGSGKTAAFGIGLLNNIQLSSYVVQSLILCPTRELADQVTKELRRLARFTQNIKIITLCGGVAIGPQIKSLSHPAHIVVGTPGRVLKHLDKGYLHIDELKTLVLDEADRMLDMGFVDEINKVMDFVPKGRQTLLFSATYTDEIRQLSLSIQNNAVNIQTISTEQPNPITEYFYATEDNNKLAALVNIVARFQPNNAIIFANTKVDVKEVSKYLNNNNIEAAALHGDLEQYQRNDVLVKFSNHTVPVLVATDVAARGLDIKELAMVVNFGLPFEQNIYTHRIGRTGRAGSTGIAVTLYWGKQEFKAEKMHNSFRKFAKATTLSSANGYFLKAPNGTIVIEAGKRNKLRPGDILGALTGDVGLGADQIGKISIYDRQSYVAIERGLVNKALKGLKRSGIKGKRFSAWIMQ
ncbi:ATP-dependent 23S rRNA helicase DbpA [hydrothermal vent metagenome]|uniref:ATP-dependent 23S rRNA helicase DbpA n=1 Tax=hydrothermal vent metagenome TaxID=652676 RepID=A0A3B0V4J3_9ZZZZ